MSEVETPDPETIEKDELIQIKFKSNMTASRSKATSGKNQTKLLPIVIYIILFKYHSFILI